MAFFKEVNIPHSLLFEVCTLAILVVSAVLGFQERGGKVGGTLQWVPLLVIRGARVGLSFLRSPAPSSGGDVLIVSFDGGFGFLAGPKKVVGSEKERKRFGFGGVGRGMWAFDGCWWKVGVGRTEYDGEVCDEDCLGGGAGGAGAFRG
jgi:hypothetical protein